MRYGHANPQAFLRCSSILGEGIMKIPRRTFLHLAAGAGTLPTISRFASAQSYPARPVRIIVGFPAGGTTDIGARLIAQWLSEQLGQQFIVENRPGAGTHAATEAVVRQLPDGYTLLMATGSNAINATLYKRMNYNFLRDTVPVAGVIRSPFVLEVHPSVPVKTVSELIAYAKANSGKLNMASFGAGTVSHLSGELFKMTTGIEMHPCAVSRLRADAHRSHQRSSTLAFDNLPASIGHIKAGKLRALAVGTDDAFRGFTGPSGLGETLPGFEASAWIGLPHQGTHRSKSSTGLIVRLTSRWPTRTSRRGLPS